MKFTNNYNLPSSIVDALCGDDYDLTNAPKNIISVTTAIAPPKIKTLEYRHNAEIEVDASELLWRMFGSACHYFIEMATKGERLSEERWYLDIKTQNIFTAGNNVKAKDTSWYSPESFYLSGKLDMYDASEKMLEDYKVTSIWSYLIEKAIKPEHEAQLNMNAFALRKIGFPVESQAIIMIFRDWSATEFKRGDYNDKITGECLLPIPIKQIKANQWNDEYTMKYINDRVLMHIEARAKGDDEIKECTPDERWSKPEKWAVKKEGGVRALRVHDTLEQAEMHKSTDKKLIIEHRPGGNGRCENYCDAANFCNFYKTTYKKEESNA